MRRWGWSRRRPDRLGKKSLPMWLRALSAAVPWITVLVLFLMITKIDGLFFLDSGTLIDLPDGSADRARCHTVAFMLYSDEGTLVFFDDTRFVLENPSQMEKLSRQLSERISYVPTSEVSEGAVHDASRPTLLLLVDKRITVEDQMAFVRIARKSGVERVMIAEKRNGGLQE